MSEGGTIADLGPSGPFPSARPVTGSASARNAETASAVLPPRRPQRALERDSLFDPLPQSALDRVPSLQDRSGRIYPCSFLPRTKRGPQKYVSVAGTYGRPGMQTSPGRVTTLEFPRSGERRSHRGRG